MSMRILSRRSNRQGFDMGSKDSRLITREPSGDIRPIEEKLNQIPFLQRIEEGSGAKLCVIAKGDAEAHINTNFRAGKWISLHLK